ncbi:MAG: hypothetical protein ABRQ24_06315 [Syntrophomonadaceae bacterium]
MKVHRHRALKWTLALCLALILGFSLTAVARNASTSESTQIPTKAQAESVIENYLAATERADVDNMVKYCMDSRGCKKFYRPQIAITIIAM